MRQFCVGVLAMAAGLASGVPAFAADGDSGFHYTYFKQAKPIVLDGTRIALKAAQQQDLDAALAAVKIVGGKLERNVLNNWWILTLANKAEPALVQQLVAALAAQPGVQFASPVFFDDFQGPMWPTQDLLVGFKPGQPVPARDALVAAAISAKAAEHDYLADVDRVTADSRNGFDVLRASNTLAANAATLFAEPDMIFSGKHCLVPSDPFFNQQWHLSNTGQSGGLVGSDMRLVPAWDITTGAASIIDVVLDNGIDLTHPDLNLYTPGNDLTGGGTAGAPGNVCDNHGTAVAGCVSARINNGLGVVGVAPACRVASARCFVSNLSCDGSWNSQATYTVNALTWAQSIGARVTNNSNGYGFTSATIDTAYANTRNAGIVHFAAAGNSGASTLGYPASIAVVNAVAAMDRNGNRTSFSQFGTGLDFCAPGAAIVTTDRQGAAGYQSTDYVGVDGTSFASPNASGVACLILSRNPALTAPLVEEIMQRSARDLGPTGYDTGYGYGYVDAQAALNLLGNSGDSCYFATPVTVGTVNGTLVGATPFAGLTSLCGQSAANADVWYQFVAPIAGTLAVSTCGTNDTGGVDAGIDTVLSLHANCFDAPLDCNDDAVGGDCGGSDANLIRDSFLTRSLAAGEAVLIRVSKFGASATGAFRLNVAFAAANDTCANAQDVSSGGTFTGNLAYATAEASIPGICGTSSNNPDVWYRYTAPANCAVLLTASTCGTNDAPATDQGIDTVLSFHASCGGPILDCNDDANGPCGTQDGGISRDSLLTRALAPAQSIYIRVSKFGGSGVGPFRLNISKIPATDSCSSAQPIAAGVPTIFCTTGATTDGPTETLCNGDGDSNVNADVWYGYTTFGPGVFTVRTCGSSFDTRIALYSNSCPTTATPNLALACNDDAGAICAPGSTNSSVSYRGVANTTYLIRVGGYSTATGPGILTVYCAADFNLSGSANVQDIFDFLSAWFASNPSADFNGAGGINISDIFDFLATWFSGC